MDGIDWEERTGARKEELAGKRLPLKRFVAETQGELEESFPVEKERE